MAEQNIPAGTQSDAQWYSGRKAQEIPTHAQIISETQAVEEALAALGRHTPAAEVQRFLALQGVNVEEEVIEKIRRCFPGCQTT